MIRGLYSAASGMMTMLSRAQLLSNNLANVDTPGFKEDTLRLKSFRNQFLLRLFGGAQQRIGVAGTGILNEGIFTNHDQGQLRESSSPLDIALQGPGFFQVQTAEGIRYTRDGHFRRNAAGQVVTAAAEQVLGADGGPITIGFGELVISREGQVIVDEVEVGQVGLVRFDQPEQLEKVGNNKFVAPPDVVAQPDTLSLVHQGFLEQSNVDPARAMASMMVAMRSYEANQRLVQAQDEMNRQAANEIGRVG